MPKLKITKKFKKNYIATSKGFPKARIIKDNDIPDKPVEYSIEHNKYGYIIKEVKMIDIPYWMYLASWLFHPEFDSNERVDWVYENLTRNKEN